MSQAKVVPQEPTRSEVSPSEAPSENSNTESLSSDMAGIEYPGKHDVKLGRGGDANSHIGNIKFRQLISQYKPRYIAASRSNKPLVAEEVVQIWRNLDPPGRFLIRSDPSLGDDSTWHDVGNRRARKKASQALREKDRSEDLVASLAHHGHVGIPGMAGAPPVLPPGVAQVPGGNAAANNMLSAAAAAMAAAANDQSRKRTRQPDITSMFGGDRRVAPRQDAPPAIDHAFAARALQQLLQNQGTAPGTQGVQPTDTASAAPAPPATAPAPQAPAPQATAQASSSGTSGLDSILLPALQLLLQQKQQQEQQQQQQQQNLSQLAAAIQSLVSPNQGQQQQQQATNGSNEGSNPQAGQLASALSALLAGANSVPPAQGSAQSTTASTDPVSSLFAQAGQYAAQPAASSTAVSSQPAPAPGFPGLFAAASSQLASNGGQGQQGGSNQSQNLDRLLAGRIIENLMNSSANPQRNGM